MLSSCLNSAHILSDPDLGGVYVQLNNGAGTFGAPTLIGAYDALVDIRVVDLDGNGFADVVFADYTTAKIGVFYNTNGVLATPPAV